MPERAPDGTAPSEPKVQPKSGLADDYAALESILSATPRGRRFLAEFARRNRAAETDMLLKAIAKLESALLTPIRQATPSNVSSELTEMSEAIAETAVREDANLPNSPPREGDGLKQDDIDRLLASRDAKAQVATGLDEAGPSSKEGPQDAEVPLSNRG